MSGLLRAEDVRVEIAGRTILDGIDIELQRGEVVAMIGPNGAGKTTLLETLAGLIRPSGGRVDRTGTVAAALQGSALARRTAIRNVELALGWWGCPRAERRDRARRALERLEAGSLADRPARALSGGEARRVHLARALAVEPDVLLLDEPFSGLDLSARADLLYSVAPLIRSDERTTLLVVHDRAEAWALADRVLVMLDGRIEGTGTPSEVFERPATLAMARFVGFVGIIDESDHVQVFRPVDIELADDADVRGTVRKRVPLEDGVRVEIDVPHGHLVANAPVPGPDEGADVGVRPRGGLRFPK